MALALRPPRVPKPKSSLPSHYHESFLEKKGPRDQDYKKFWAGLQGLTLYFYNSYRDSQYMEKLDLGVFVKLTDEAPWGSSHDPGTHFCLVLRNQEIKFKVESLESREMWKGFILTVVELRVPSNLTLLPGHLYMMAEALAKEEARRALEMPSTPVVRHYKFSCTSLDAVVNYFVSHSNKKLMPFLLDDDYEKVIGWYSLRELGGPSPRLSRPLPDPDTLGSAPSRRASSRLPSLFQATWRRIKRMARVGGPKQLPPSSIAPVSSQDKLPPLLNQDENYVIPTGDAPAANYVNQDVPSPSRPVVLKPRKLAMFQAKPPKSPIVPKSGRGPSSQPLPHPAKSQPQPSSAFSTRAQKRPQQWPGQEAGSKGSMQGELHKRGT
ncbi:hypothetical protein E2I00_009811, partial [Balaenoptera physalus]